MKTAIMVVDMFVRFRLLALAQSPHGPQRWERDVISLEDAAFVLVALGFLEAEAAVRLVAGNKTITPQEGLTIVPFSDFVALVELASPGDEPPSAEAQQGYVLLSTGEISEEALAAVGFALKGAGPVQ